MASEPQNLQYKAAYMQTRERALTTYIYHADAQAGAGKPNEAEVLYQRALVLEPGNERAQAGLQALGVGKRHAQLFREAQAAAERQDGNEAHFKLNHILAENPNHAAAGALKRSLAEKAVAAPMVETALSAAYKKPISIEFRDAQLRQVFEVIAISSGLNFVFDKDVKTDQKTSIFLKNSTIESAVYMMLMTNQLEQQVLDANTILIYPNTVAKQKDYQELVVKSFFLTSADAKTVAATVKAIVKSRDIVVDEKLNMIIVRDTADALKLTEKLVALHDAPEPEVMLEVEILEVKRSRLLNLGIQWPDTLSLTALPAIAAPVLRDFRDVNSGTIGVNRLGVTINAKNIDTDTNLLANPRIRTRNREKAKIVIGEKVPIISTTTAFAGGSPISSETITYIDVGLKLDVEPTIYLNNDVAIKISLEVNNLGAPVPTTSGSAAYRIGTRTASTVLRLKDGETQVLAGLINDEDRRSASKVPGLGELPVVGRLFGSAQDDKDKTEIVLSITPRIIRNIQRPSAALSEFRSGTESGFRSAPDGSVRSNALVPPMMQPAVNFAPAPLPVITEPARLMAPNPGGTVGTGSVAGAFNPAPLAASGAESSSKSMYIEWMGRTQLKVGDPFEVQLIMESKQPVTAIAAAIGFDTRALQVVGVSESAFLKQGGAKTTFFSQVDPSGQISFQGARLPGTSSSDAMTPDVIATIHFRALAPSDGALVKLLSMTSTDAAGRTLTASPLTPHVVRIQR